MDHHHHHHHLAAFARDMGYNEDYDSTSDHEDECYDESDDWDKSNEWDDVFDERFNIKVFSETEDLLLSIEKAEEDVNENEDVNEIVGDIVDNLAQKAVATHKIDVAESLVEQQIPEKPVNIVYSSPEHNLEDPVDTEDTTASINDESKVKYGAEENDPKIIPRRSKRLAEKFKEEVPQKVKKMNEDD
jgi:hypothetical protein